MTNRPSTCRCAPGFSLNSDGNGRLFSQHRPSRRRPPPSITAPRPMKQWTRGWTKIRGGRPRWAMSARAVATGLMASRDRNEPWAAIVRIARRPAPRNGSRHGQPDRRDGASSRLIPLDGAAEAVLEAGRRFEAEALPGAGRVERPTRLAVGLAGVPAERTLEVRQPGDELDELAD